MMPGPRAPRLYLVSNGVKQRWRHSGFFPAFKRAASVLRFAMRLKAMSGLDASRTQLAVGEPGASGSGSHEEDPWPVRRFLADALPRADAAVVCVGTPGPAQKFTVQLWNGHHEVLGYLKYGQSEAARERILHEYRVLEELPPGIGPGIVAFGPFEDGLALATEPVAGRQAPARWSSLGEAHRFAARLDTGRMEPFSSHPWLVAMATAHGEAVEPWIEPLAGRDWPVVVQHGDLAPWNLIRGASGLRAIDWEYGRTESFPWLDQAYFILRLAQAIYGKSVADGVAEAVRRLEALGLRREEALAIVRLAAFDFYLKARRDGAPDRHESQAWLRAVYEWQGRP